MLAGNDLALCSLEVRMMDCCDMLLPLIQREDVMEVVARKGTHMSSRSPEDPKTCLTGAA